MGTKATSVELFDAKTGSVAFIKVKEINFYKNIKEYNNDESDERRIFRRFYKKK